jgi:aminopeptidase
VTSELAQGRDVYISTQRDVDRVSVTSAPLVFVGYGVNAPEKGWDDFKGVDLKGKIAVFLVNDPDFAATGQDAVAGRFGGRAMTYYGRWSYKFEEAARRGAIGALIVHQTEAAGYGWNTVIAPQGENFDLAQGGAANDRLMMQGWLGRGRPAPVQAGRSGSGRADCRRPPACLPPCRAGWVDA